GQRPGEVALVHVLHPLGSSCWRFWQVGLCRDVLLQAILVIKVEPVRAITPTPDLTREVQPVGIFAVIDDRHLFAVLKDESRGAIVVRPDDDEGVTSDQCLLMDLTSKERKLLLLEESGGLLLALPIEARDL